MFTKKKANHIIFKMLMGLVLFAPAKMLGQDAAPSSHLYYSGGNSTSDIWMNQVYVPTTTLYTYYSTMGWNTGSEGGGYCGIQDSPDGGHKYIFSIWDPSNHQAITAAYAGPGTNILNFGGEGTGLQSNNPSIGWNINTWYNQVTRVWQYNGHTHFGFWIQDMNTGTWTHMVTMDYPVANVKFNNSNDAFIEDWQGSGANVRKVLFKEAWQRSTTGTWALQKAATFSSNSGDATRNGIYNEAFNTGIENGAFFMQIGGNTTHTFSGRSTDLSVTSSATSPTLTIGALASFQTIYQSSNKTILANWATDQTKSPQYSYTIDVFNNAQYTGSPVLTATDNVPHLRNTILNVASLTNGTYYVRLTIKDIFDQTSVPIYSSFTKNNAPTVSISSPANNATFNSPASIIINANAADDLGTVSNVEFYNGGTLIGSDNTSPYSVTWSNVGYGTYSITAKATNNSGASSTSSPVTVIVNSSCNVGGTSFGTSPAYGNGSSTYDKAFDGNTSTVFDYSQANGGYTGLDFGAGKTMYVNTIKFYPRSGWGSRMTGGKFQGSNTADFSSGVVDLYTINSTPADAAWTTVNITPTAGYRYVRYLSPANGYCNVAEIQFCGDFSLANVAPSVSITSPSNGATFTAPASVTISANASDSDGTISKVEFYNGATLLNTDNASPYSYDWTNVAAGIYNLTAKAYDNNDAITTSSVVSITVNSAANQAPTVSITSPSNGATFTAPASVNISANASDADGSITKVEFYNGASLLTTVSAYPYTYALTSVAAGTYSLTAKAYDNSGAVTTSSAVSITVNAPANQAPTVSITSPSNGATFTASASVNISANASDADGSISKVEFYNGASLLSTVSASPYTYTWTSVAAGTYSLTAKAYDNSGAVTTSSAVSITVNVPANQAPTVSITSPSNGATFTAPASVTISANASDADGTISKVEFYNGATLLNTDNASPYSFAWTGVAAGSYSLTAKAYDNSGAVTTSSTVSITVSSGGSCTAQQWVSANAYSGGAVVQYLGIKYVANWWTQGDQPDTHSGPTGSGQPWTSQGTCNTRLAVDQMEVLNSTFTVYPNPVNEMLWIQLDGMIESVEIIDAEGRVYIKENNQNTINVTSLTSGLYFVKVIKEGTTLVRRFSKQ